MTRELAIVRRDPVLARLDIARSALAKAQTIQAVKQIADLATAAKVYARQQKLGQESIGFANAVKVEALRRLGEILKQTERNKGGAGRLGGGTSGTQKVPLLDAPPTLADEGLTKKESALAQKLASLPVEQFEQVKEGTASVAKALSTDHARPVRGWQAADRQFAGPLASGAPFPPAGPRPANGRGRSADQ